MSSSIRILSSADIDNLLTLPSTTQSVLSSQSQIFQAYSQHNSTSNPTTPTPPPIQAPLRTTISTPDVTTLIMPALASGLGGIGIKVVSVPNQGDGGLPATTTVFDSTTGKLRAVVNARALTALRNACGSVLFLQSTLPPASPPSHLLLFGSGAQIRSHAILIQHYFPTITRISIIARSLTSRLSTLQEELSGRFGEGVTVQAGTEGTLDLPELLKGADVVVCATPSTSPLFPSSYIPEEDSSDPQGKKTPKSFILIGSYKPHMIELPPDLIERVIEAGGKIVVDSLSACLAEAGELQNVERGDCVELGSLLSNHSTEGVKTRTEGAGLRVYKSVGIAVQDVAVAHTMILAAETNRVGTVVDGYD